MIGLWLMLLIGFALGGLAMQLWMQGEEERQRKLWQAQVDRICDAWDIEGDGWERLMRRETGILRAALNYERARRARAESRVLEMTAERDRRN